MSAPRARFAGRRVRCDACGHDTTDADLLGVPIGATANVVLVACPGCREQYGATGRLPHGLAHCSELHADQDVTDDLIADGYVNESGEWPATGEAS